jgi:hypothetical protein
MAKSRQAKDFDGDKLLYPYLQKELLVDDIWLFQMLTSRLVTALGVWPHPEAFRRVPVLLPYAIRDESARGRKAGTEQWASPNSAGLLRDDNSLVKERFKTLAFQSPRSLYSGRRIGRGKGWVAAHVWQVRRDGERASRNPLTNSFLANLVWLPRDLAQLSDRPGSFVQRYLQALSHKVDLPDRAGLA